MKSVSRFIVRLAFGGMTGVILRWFKASIKASASYALSARNEVAPEIQTG
jgi:hypothetical protein